MFAEVLKELLILARLARLRMTIFSAVTYSVAFTIGLHQKKYMKNIEMDIGVFLIGWVFVLLCQLSAHLLGEYYDFAADTLCKHNSTITGGSRVLVNGEFSAQKCHFLGWFCSVVALVLLFQFLPRNVHCIGFLMAFLSSQYSGAPLRLNHRAFGEVTAALIMNILLPYFAALLASPLSVSLHGSLSILVIPSAIGKFALFIILNLADKQSDAQAGKITLPVLIGESSSKKLYSLCIITEYLSTVLLFLYFYPVIPFISFLLVLATTIPSVSICSALLRNDQPLQLIVFRSLIHAPLPVVAVFVDFFARELFLSTSLYHIFSLPFQLRCLPMYPYLFMTLSPLLFPPKPKS